MSFRVQLDVSRPILTRDVSRSYLVAIACLVSAVGLVAFVWLLG